VPLDRSFIHSKNADHLCKKKKNQLFSQDEPHVKIPLSSRVWMCQILDQVEESQVFPYFFANRYQQWLHAIELIQISAFFQLPSPRLTPISLVEKELGFWIFTQLANHIHGYSLWRRTGVNGSNDFTFVCSRIECLLTSFACFALNWCWNLLGIVVMGGRFVLSSILVPDYSAQEFPL
jgi:hypothetical protein